MPDYDALVLLSFGGPESRDDVIPFLENVLRGRNVPRERMLEVAEHYYHFGGVSPINAQCRQLLGAIQAELAEHAISLPVYWGNRNWHPFLSDTLQQMRADGIRSALGFATAGYSSYSSCRQYLDDIERARAVVGEGAPEISKLRPFFNHPGFIATMVDQSRRALARVPQERHGSTEIVYTAHSIPLSMARSCDYEQQLQEVARLVQAELGKLPHRLVYQSRSGPPSQPWLEPDVGDYLRQLAAAGRTTDVVIVPIGFTSDHMEVLYDLDTEAQQICADLGLKMVRAGTAGTHPRFVGMIRELVQERLLRLPPSFVGTLGPRPEPCVANCCPSGRPPVR
ncbi:MAG: ferrochelatase [Pirellulaceae bacterium]